MLDLIAVWIVRIIVGALLFTLGFMLLFAFAIAMIAHRS